MKLRVETEINPTEVPEKVEAALKMIFPTLNFDRVGNFLVGESTDVYSLARFYQILRQQMILDTARRVMRANRKGNLTMMSLNKQVAAVSRVSFTNGESPLGPITVRLEDPEIERLIDYLAPRTRGGRPIQEMVY